MGAESAGVGAASGDLLMSYFGMHNLAPLCGTNGYYAEQTAKPFLDDDRVCATNGHAILFVRDPALTREAKPGGPPLAQIDSMPWRKKERIVSVADLRAFLRRDPRRDIKCNDGQTRELVCVHGVMVNAELFRRYLPGSFGKVRLSRCGKLDWHAMVKEPPALRMRADGWELIVMALVGNKAKASFPEIR